MSNDSRIGFVYILGNPCMPGIFKVGQSERHPGARAEELSEQSGVPAPFEVIYFREVNDRLKAEQCVHKELDRFRVSSNKEFFRSRNFLHIRATVDQLLDAYEQSTQ